MKIINNILFYIFSIVIGLLSIVMIVIELRLLVSLDFIIYDSMFNGFMRYFLRLIISCSFLFMILCENVKKLKNNSFIKNNLLFFEMLLLIVSIIMFVLATNYIGIITLLLMIIFISLKLLKINFDKKPKKN